MMNEATRGTTSSVELTLYVTGRIFVRCDVLLVLTYRVLCLEVYSVSGYSAL